MIYVANDVESAGRRLGVHSTLSWGACMITRENLSFEDYWGKGLIFYAELRPDSLVYETDATKVGCSQLICLEEIKKTNSYYDTKSQNFSSLAVLELMQKKCEYQRMALHRFYTWVNGLKFKYMEDKVMGVTDTVFFDGGRVEALLGWYPDQYPCYKHSGLDLDSIYRGYVRRPDAKLKELGVLDQRAKPHRADHDAVYLAQIARELLFNRMGW